MRLEARRQRSFLLSFLLLELVGSCCQAFTFLATPSRQSVLDFHGLNKHLHHALNDPNEINCEQPLLLTVILPAYNESLRIGETLRLYRDYLATNHEGSSEILVVDDGSTDGTKETVQSFSIDKTTTVVPVFCVSLESNQGKGAALAKGIDHIVTISEQENSNSLILIADADASADIACLPDFVENLQGLAQKDWSVPALVVGRRTYEDEDELSPTRLLLRWGFRTAVRLLCGDLGVSDTQCGFKLMTLAAAQQLYRDLHLRGWSHDVEVLYRAREGNIPVSQCDVLWQDKEGSKLVTSSAGGTAGASLKMLLEIAQLRLWYAAGIWK